MKDHAVVAPQHPRPSDEATRSVLICDDRVDVRQELSRMLAAGSRYSVVAVADGDALLAAYRATIGQVLIGVHSATAVGSDAFTRFRATHPAAIPIVFGALAEIDLLSGYLFDAGGLLLWEAGKPWPVRPAPTNGAVGADHARDWRLADQRVHA